MTELIVTERLPRLVAERHWKDGRRAEVRAYPRTSQVVLRLMRNGEVVYRDAFDTPFDALLFADAYLWSEVL